MQTFRFLLRNLFPCPNIFSVEIITPRVSTIQFFDKFKVLNFQDLVSIFPLPVSITISCCFISRNSSLIGSIIRKSEFLSRVNGDKVLSISCFPKQVVKILPFLTFDVFMLSYRIVFIETILADLSVSIVVSKISFLHYKQQD